MELVRYWRIVFRRWWLIVGLVLVVGAVSGVTYDWSPVQQYTTSFRFNVGIDPSPPGDATYEYNPLDVWQTSEYLMDDLASAVRGAEFARRVAARLETPDVNLAGKFGAATDHRVLTVSVLWPDAAQLGDVANAAVTVLQEEGGELVGPLGEAQPVLRLIDPPVVVPVGRSLKDKLDLPIRIGLALAVGIGAAFLIDYLDTTVRDPQEVEELGIPVLAKIPRHR
jgi:capsular polysaccharide biosynthesis protein